MLDQQARYSDETLLYLRVAQLWDVTEFLWIAGPKRRRFASYPREACVELAVDRLPQGA